MCAQNKMWSVFLPEVRKFSWKLPVILEIHLPSTTNRNLIAIHIVLVHPTTFPRRTICPYTFNPPMSFNPASSAEVISSCPCSTSFSGGRDAAVPLFRHLLVK